MVRGWIYKDYFEGYLKKGKGGAFGLDNVHGVAWLHVHHNEIEKKYISEVDIRGMFKGLYKLFFKHYCIIINETNEYDFDNYKIKDCLIDFLNELGNGDKRLKMIKDLDCNCKRYYVIMELFTGKYIKKIVPDSCIIKMLNYKGGEGDD